MSDEYNPNMSTKTEGLKKNIMESLESLERKAEKRGYLKGKDEAVEEVCKREYQRGLETAWEIAQKLIVMTKDDYVKCFGEEKGIEYFYADDFGELAVNEAVDAVTKLNYEPYQNIKVGDEVIDPNNLRAIVTNVDTHYHLLYLASWKTWKAPKSTRLKKTGKQYDLACAMRIGYKPF